MELIGEEITIEGISGRVMRMKDNETVVLFDGKTNHEVKIPKMKKCLSCEIEKLESQFDGKYCTRCMEKAKEKRSIGVKACSKCKVEKPLIEFRQFSDKRHSKMCDKCRDKNANAGTIKMKNKRVKVNDTKQSDPVNHPSHYNQGGIETLDIIKMCLTEEEYKGYLKGNVLKYRERSQFKGNAEQDYAKAKFYFDELKE